MEQQASNPEDQALMEAAIGLLQAYFPGEYYAESTVTVWASDLLLLGFDHEDVKTAVVQLGRTRYTDVKLAHLIDECEGVRASRRTGAELPAYGHWTDEDARLSREAMEAAMAQWRSRHPAGRSNT